MDRKMFTFTTTLTVASVLALIIAVTCSKAILPKAHAGEDSLGKEGCSVATLQGDYLFTVLSFNRSDLPDPGHPLTQAGVRTFDGKGALSQVSTTNVGGEIHQLHIIGSYTLDSDCTGTMDYAEQHWNIYVTTDGSEGVSVNGRLGHISAGIATQSFKKRSGRGGHEHG